MLGARRAPVPAHAAASGTHASIRNRWDGRNLCRHHARRLLRRCKNGMIFSAFSSVTRGQRSKAVLPQHDVTPSARPPVLSPARFRLSHGPLRGGTDSSARGQGFWCTLPSVDRAKRAGSPLNRPSAPWTPSAPSRAALADGEKGTNRALRARRRCFRGSKGKTARGKSLRLRVGCSVGFGAGWEHRQLQYPNIV